MATSDDEILRLADAVAAAIRNVTAAQVAYDEYKAANVDRDVREDEVRSAINDANRELVDAKAALDRGVAER